MQRAAAGMQVGVGRGWRAATRDDPGRRRVARRAPRGADRGQLRSGEPGQRASGSAVVLRVAKAIIFTYMKVVFMISFCNALDFSM